LIAGAVLASLCVLLIGALLVAVMTLDIEHYHAAIEAQLGRSIGREITIGGPIRFERSLRPRFVVEDVSIANPAGSSRTAFATAKRLEFRMSLFPLLRGHLRLVEVTLQGADIVLERSRSGAQNWVFGESGDGSVPQGIVAEVLALRVLESRIGYRSPDGKQIDARIDVLEAQLVLDKPVRVGLTATLQDLPLQATLEGDTLEALLATKEQWKFQGDLAGGGLDAKISGRLRDPLSLKGASLSVRLKGSGTEELRSAWMPDMPDVAEFDGEVHITSDGTGVRFEANAKGTGVKLDPLWHDIGEKSPLAFNMRGVELKAQGKGDTLADSMIRAGWKIAAEGVELRLEREGKEPFAVKRGTIDVSAPAGETIEVRAKGSSRDGPVTLRGTFGKVEALLAPKAPWSVDLAIETGPAGVEFHGSVRKPLSRAGLEGRFRVRADKLSSLSALAGYELPEQGPVGLTGRLLREPRRAELADIEFTLGQSRLRIDAAWSAMTSPRLRVAIRPSRIRFEDLRQPAKSEVAPEAEDVSTVRERVVPALPAAKEWIRHEDIDVSLDELRFVDAEREVALLSGQLRVKNGRLVLRIGRSVITGAPIIAGINIDATSDPATVEMEIDVDSLDYGAILKASGVTDRVQGTLGVEARLIGTGNDLRATLQSAQGEVEVIGGQGRLRGRLLELWGGSMTRLLNPVAWAQGRDTDLNCIAGRFAIGDGFVRSELLLLDSKDVTVAGEMVLNLATEEINGLFKPQPKQASLVRLSEPLQLSGTLGSPKVGVSEQSLLTIGKLAIGITQPYALILFFSDLGPKEKNPCAALLEQKGGEVGSPARTGNE